MKKLAKVTEMAKADNTAYLTGWTAYDVTVQVSYCFRRDSTDMWKVEKEMASLTEDETEVSAESVQASEHCETHPILVTRINIKEGDAFQLITKVFNWHGRMDLLCLQ